MSIQSVSSEKKVFSLGEAASLMPLVQKITHNTVERVNELTNQLGNYTETDPEFEEIGCTIDALVKNWVEQVRKLGCDVKGLWLVDFDNGHGYYCWAYPEDNLDHFHGYEEGFRGRIRIC